jgi:protein phosphatase
MNGNKWLAAICCEAGSLRPDNQDNFYCNGLFKTVKEANQNFYAQRAFTRQGLFAVFDGMGGESYGELASAMAASLLHKQAKKILARPNKYLPRFIGEANKRVCLEAAGRGLNIGPTLALALVKGEWARAVNLGDSRVYLWQNGGLIRLSEDHRALYQHGRRLSQYLGVAEEEFIIEPHYAAVKLYPGDKLLLCSDGLTDMLDDDALKSILMLNAQPKEIACKLGAAALGSGGKDNITALVLARQ